MTQSRPGSLGFGVDGVLLTLPPFEPLSGSKDELHLHPHATDAAVGEVAIQEASWRSPLHAHRRDLDELRVIEGVQRFSTELQAARLADRNGLC